MCWKEEGKKIKQRCMSDSQGHTYNLWLQRGTPPQVPNVLCHWSSNIVPCAGERVKSECRISPESPHQMVMFQIVFLRWACDLLYSRGAPASRDGMNNTSDRALIRQLTWLPSVATRNKVDISGSLSPEASLAHFWDMQPHGGTDTQGQTGGS